MVNGDGKWLRNIECKSAGEFIDYLRLGQPQWSSDGLVSSWLFRGHQDATWQLCPRAWREERRGDVPRYRTKIAESNQLDRLRRSQEDLDRPPFGLPSELREQWQALDEGDKSDRVRRFLEQVFFEVQVVRDFWEIANEVGHPVDVPSWIELDHRLSELIRLLSSGVRESFFESPLFATAQHHGVPTRLLDWTLRPLNAAYFATEGVKADAAKPVAVWAVRKDVIKRTRLREYHVPRHLLRFLHAQAGCFVWDPDANGHFALEGSWPDQLDAIRELHTRHTGPNPPRPWVYQVTVPTTEADRVVEMLWKEGVSRAHLMPTLDNVAQTLWTSTSWRTDRSMLD